MRWKQWRFVYYPAKMFDGEDVGELYDMENDPLEQRNLYHDPEHREVVHTCRHLLLDWLIEHVIPSGLINQAEKQGYPMPTCP